MLLDLSDVPHTLRSSTVLTAAGSALKSALPSDTPSLPSPPSLTNPADALRSSSDAANSLSLPEAPSLSGVGQDSTAVQQVRLSAVGCR